MFGKKLKELRSGFKVTQTVIAHDLGINQDIVSKIENDKRTLTSLEMFKLSKKFDIPIGFFFGEVNLKKFLHIHFRATEDLKGQDQKKIPLLKEIARKQYDIEDVLKIKHDRILRKYPINKLDYIKIRDVALAERKILGFDNKEPIRDLLGLLRSQGIKILEPILEYAVNGMFLTLDDIRFLIIINEDNSPAVRNFSLAHEYGHYLFNRGDAFNIISKNIEKWEDLGQKETIVSVFAAEFLMPEQSLALIFRLKNLNQISNGQMQHYLSSKHFKPIEALKKLEKLGMKSDEVKHYELSNAIGKWPEAKRKKRKRIDAKAILSSEYKRMVLAAYERGLITYRKVADYLFLDVDELKKIVAEKEVTYEI
jgi:Zn-dependent peptidase ImmA (M78 family)/DNA-binding XRE family transcriptional regulator